MTDKQLKKASRKELIELLYAMSKELDRVRSENEKLTSRIDAFAMEGAKHMQAADIQTNEEK